MRLVKLIPLFLGGAIWRMLGIRSIGRTLVRALGTNDEQGRMIAGMFLVKGGKRAEPLLQEALARRENVPVLLTVLASIGDPAVEPQLRRFADDKDPQISRAARDALRIVLHKA